MHPAWPKWVKIGMAVDADDAFVVPPYTQFPGSPNYYRDGHNHSCDIIIMSLSYHSNHYYMTIKTNKSSRATAPRRASTQRRDVERRFFFY